MSQPPEAGAVQQILIDEATLRLRSGQGAGGGSLSSLPQKLLPPSSSSSSISANNATTSINAEELPSNQAEEESNGREKRPRVERLE